MHKIKKPLFMTAAALVLVAAAVLGALSAVKTTPWELTYHLVPSDVSQAIIWQGAYSSQLTEDEIIKVVHMLNQLEKSAFTIKYGHTSAKPQFGLTVQCGTIEIRLDAITSKHGSLYMTFDETTAKSFTTGQWYVDNRLLSAYITELLSARQGGAS
jgi:hypothetical protein